MLLLKELIAHAGEVVTREHLIAILWPKGVVDFDTGLNTAVRKLRNALGDTVDTPRYIETLPRRGYRFIGTLDADPEVRSASGASAGRASSGPGKPTAQLDVLMPAPVPSGSGPAAAEEATSSIATAIAPTPYSRLLILALITALAAAALLTGVYVLWRARPGASVTRVRVETPLPSRLPANVAPTSAVPFNPAPHSVAVLPFVNLSGDKEQEYFSDGLTEELLNSLTRIDGLQVAARTSSFSFREHPNVADMARKLNVSTVLEGSVRRSGHTIRISAQLINALTGFHLWSKTYDRDLGDVLKVQAEIATAVASALEVTLLADTDAKIEMGGTRNPAAFDAYLRASKAFTFAHDAKDVETAIAAFSEAIRLDPNYALAFAYRSLAWTDHAEETGATIGTDDDRALADAHQARSLAPELAEGHLALAFFFQDRALDFAHTQVELEHAIALAPGAAQIVGWYGRFAVMTGRTDAGIAAVRRAVVLDPLNPGTHYRLAQTLYYARRYAEAVAVSKDLLALDPQEPDSFVFRGLAYYGLGDFQSARLSCEAGPNFSATQFCLAVTYHRLGRHADAEVELSKLRAEGDRWAYRCAEIYAQWGNAPQALEWLDTAMRRRVPFLRWLKIDPLMDPLRQEPRFQAIERALKFPN